MNRYIAMWSGPRNISTAMMRAWGNRPDTFVCDEPLYAHYLCATNHTDHPGFEQIINQHETDWRKVVTWLTGPVPEGKDIFYQKHMAHHVLPDMPMDWISQLSNCLLIREPRETLLSLIEFLPSPSLEETGLPQQVRLYEYAAERSAVAPPIVDATDVLSDPVGILQSLCAHLDVPFYEQMLHWPPGPRDTDGVWASYWYGKTYESTSFGPHRPKDGQVPERILPVLERCQELYAQLYERRLRPNTKQPARATSCPT
jgi:Sulfotransferase domain